MTQKNVGLACVLYNVQNHTFSFAINIFNRFKIIFQFFGRRDCVMIYIPFFKTSFKLIKLFQTIQIQNLLLKWLKRDQNLD